MLVLPFEHKRMLAIHGLEYSAYLGEIQFWQYHLRDLANVIDKKKSQKDQLSSLSQ